MGITIDWFDEEETTLLWQFGESWTSEDFRRAYQNCAAILEPQNESINLIMDFTFSAIKPRDCLSYIRQFLKKCPHNLQDILVVSPSNFWRKIFQAVLEATNINRSIQFINSLDEIYQYADSD